MYQCVYCSDIVQYTYGDGSTELGNWVNHKRVGQHVYMKRGTFVYGFLYVCVCLCVLDVCYVCLCVFVCLCVHVCACVYVCFVCVCMCV